MDNQKVFTTLDVHEAAFLILNGEDPFVTSNERGVHFHFFSSHRLTNLLLRYRRGACIEVMPFVTTVRRILEQTRDIKAEGDSIDE